MEIHGIVVTRNDWGVLALSVCNALKHVDVVHVLNHGSSDQTEQGLEILKEIWGDRLQTYTAKPGTPFEQSLLTNMVASFAEAAGADWIYVFDSDEFLLSKPGFSLKSELSKLNDSVLAVRYRIYNYISTFDFEKTNLDDYRKVIYKSKPFKKYDPANMWDPLYSGQLSFYDIHFIPKIIFRAKKNLLVTDGSHDLRWTYSGHSIFISSAIECAHLMLVSKDILKRKSALGESHIKMGLPLRHGLRNQLINKLESEGRLDWFWERHSIQTGNGDSHNPKHTIDESLVESLKDSVEILREKFGGADLAMRSGTPLKRGCDHESAFTFDNIFQVCEFFKSRLDLLSNFNAQNQDL